MRLDRFIQRRIPRLSRARAQAIIRACAFRQDGSRRRPGDIVHEGDTVLLVREGFEEPTTPQDFRIIHEDDDLLAIDKPPGLPMHPTATYHKNTLSYLLRERFGANPERIPQIAHRLDRETSGLVLCGKHHRALRALKMSFEAHRVHKTYLAIVAGQPRDEGTVELPMAPVEEGLHVMMEVRSRGGLPAHTSYRVVERRKGHALLELSPVTGRQHQLRVHMAAIGHPIIGDKLYGPEREAPFLEIIEKGLTEDLLARLGHPRHALHAHSLSFAHPASDERWSLEAPLAADLTAYWDGLELDQTDAKQC